VQVSPDNRCAFLTIRRESSFTAGINLEASNPGLHPKWVTMQLWDDARRRTPQPPALDSAP